MRETEAPPLRVVSTGGGHEIETSWAGQRVVLVRVRPVGLLEMGELREVFAPEWVPQLVEALQLAHKIANRNQPWKPWIEGER